MNISAHPSVMSPPSMSQPLVVLRTCFLAVLGLIIILGNLLSIAVTRRVPDSDIAASTKVLMTSLAAYDLLAGFMAVSCLTPASALDRWPYGRPGCHVATTLLSTTLCMSGFSLIFLNVERYVAVTRPYAFPVWCSRRRCIALVLAASCLTLAMISGAPFVFDITVLYFPAPAVCFYDNASVVVNTLALLLLNIIPVLVIVYIYYHLIKISRDHQQRLRHGARGIHDNKALKTFLVVTLAVGGCYTPIMVTRTVEAFLQVQSPAWLQCGVFWLPICNSAFNVFIYCVFNGSYRQTAARLIAKRLPCCIKPSGVTLQRIQL